MILEKERQRERGISKKGYIVLYLCSHFHSFGFKKQLDWYANVAYKTEGGKEDESL